MQPLISVHSSYTQVTEINALSYDITSLQDFFTTIYSLNRGFAVSIPYV